MATLRKLLIVAFAFVLTALLASAGSSAVRWLRPAGPIKASVVQNMSIEQEDLNDFKYQPLMSVPPETKTLPSFLYEAGVLPINPLFNLDAPGWHPRTVLESQSELDEFKQTEGYGSNDIPNFLRPPANDASFDTDVLLSYDLFNPHLPSHRMAQALLPKQQKGVLRVAVLDTPLDPRLKPAWMRNVSWTQAADPMFALFWASSPTEIAEQYCPDTPADALHGSKVAWTISAGIHRSAPDTVVNITSVPLTAGCEHESSPEAIAQVLAWTAEQHFDVVNISMALFMGSCPASYQRAIDDMNARGTLVVASLDARNSAPASCRGVIAAVSPERPVPASATDAESLIVYSTPLVQVPNWDVGFYLASAGYTPAAWSNFQHASATASVVSATLALWKLQDKTAHDFAALARQKNDALRWRFLTSPSGPLRVIQATRLLRRVS